MNEKDLENLFDNFLEKKIKTLFVNKLNNILSGRITSYDNTSKTVSVKIDSNNSVINNLLLPVGTKEAFVGEKCLLVSPDSNNPNTLYIVSVLPNSTRKENVVLSGASITNSVVNNSNISGASITGGSWLTWTPTWTGLSVYNGTLTAKYLKIGTNVNYSMRIIFGSSTSVTGSVTFSKPLSSVSTNVFDPYCSNLIMRDVSAPQNFFGLPRNSSDSVFNIGSYITSGSNIVIANIGASYPFQWGVSDVISAQGFYESVN